MPGVRSCPYASHTDHLLIWHLALPEPKRGLGAAQALKPARGSLGTPKSDEIRYGRPLDGLRLRTYTIIFEADTASGRLFDVLLIGAILISVAVVMFDSVASIRTGREQLFSVLEWGFTLLFTLEYVARLSW